LHEALCEFENLVVVVVHRNAGRGCCIGADVRRRITADRPSDREAAGAGDRSGLADGSSGIVGWTRSREPRPVA
jgi:hypothetical protein